MIDKLTIINEEPLIEPQIKVIGVGGGGGNAVNHMYRLGIKDVGFVVCNTDAQALKHSPIATKIQLGPELTEGRGAGSKPDKGREAAIESLDDIREIFKGKTEMVFITAGMGGGTGTGAAPVIAKAAKEAGVLTVGVVTLPFLFERSKSMEQAKKGIELLGEQVDAILVINNQKLRDVYGNLTVSQAFAKADDVIANGAKSMVEIITVAGYINVDIADVKSVMSDSGVAIMGSGTAKGKDRVTLAIKEALRSPLLNNNSVYGARKMLLNIISGNKEVTMKEIDYILEYIHDLVGIEETNLIWGNSYDDDLDEEIRITIVATDFIDRQDEESQTIHEKANQIELILENQGDIEDRAREKQNVMKQAKRASKSPKKNVKAQLRMFFNSSDDKM